MKHLEIRLFRRIPGPQNCRGNHDVLREAGYVFFGASQTADRHTMVPYLLHFEIMKKGLRRCIEWATPDAYSSFHRS